MTLFPLSAAGTYRATNEPKQASRRPPRPAASRASDAPCARASAASCAAPIDDHATGTGGKGRDGGLPRRRRAKGARGDEGPDGQPGLVSIYLSIARASERASDSHVAFVGVGELTRLARPCLPYQASGSPWASERNWGSRVGWKTNQRWDS